MWQLHHSLQNQQLVFYFYKPPNCYPAKSFPALSIDDTKMINIDTIINSKCFLRWKYFVVNKSLPCSIANNGTVAKLAMR
ncbi:hypothetical protein, partial [Escherichia coli]|uniref:hypothetical protein n=1 Tax=Escherichia coli TaxID=562 RepID=UPI0020267C40